MIVTLVDGTTTSLAFCPANCTGYRAEKIEFDARDVAAMRRLAEFNFSVFHTAMLQLEGRFKQKT